MASTNRDWMQEAACKDRPDLDWFDLECSLMAFLAVCAECPVGDACLEYAIRNDITEGLWGGEWGYRLKQYTQPGGTNA
jgi:hypothetical protein